VWPRNEKNDVYPLRIRFDNSDEVFSRDALRAAAAENGCWF
jgi:hypothetical protein